MYFYFGYCFAATGRSQTLCRIVVTKCRQKGDISPSGQTRLDGEDRGVFSLGQFGAGIANVQPNHPQPESASRNTQAAYTLITTTTASPRNNGIDPRERLPAGRERGLPDFSKPVAATRRPRIVAHPVAQHALTALRDQRTRAKSLRYFGNQLLTHLTVEATGGLPTREIDIEQSGGLHASPTLARQVVFLSLTRHGLGLSHNVAELIPGVSIGSITLESPDKNQSPEPRFHLANAPALHEARVIVFDPVVSSGRVAGLALQMLRRSGATDLALASFVIGNQSLDHLLALLPDLAIVTAAVDDYDPKRGLRPGLGDFAERLYAAE